MAIPKGLWSAEAVPAGWFDESAQAAGWFDDAALDSASGAYTISAAQGSFSLSGQASALLAARLLPASPGTFTLTGEAATLAAQRIISAGQGSFALAGQSATLTYSGGSPASYSLTAAAGAFALSGQDAALTYTPVTPPAQEHGGSWVSPPLKPREIRQLHMQASAGYFRVYGKSSYYAIGQSPALIAAKALRRRHAAMLLLD